MKQQELWAGEEAMVGRKFGGRKASTDVVCWILRRRNITPFCGIGELQQLADSVPDVDVESVVCRFYPAEDGR